MLIQIGGMGVVTVAVAIATISGRKIGLMQRSVMQEAISAHQVGGIVRMTKFILKTSILIEVIGRFFIQFFAEILDWKKESGTESFTLFQHFVMRDLICWE